MRVFLDTNVLVAGSIQSHPHHAQAWTTLQRSVRGPDHGVIAAHSVAEFYAVLTRLPLRPRILPLEATRMLEESLLPHLELVPAAPADYRWALRLVSSRDMPGAVIYDALLISCALRAKVKRIYTFNLADFRRLMPTEVHTAVCAPS